VSVCAFNPNPQTLQLNLRAVGVRAVGDRVLVDGMRVALRVLGYLRLEGCGEGGRVAWTSAAFTCLVAQAIDTVRAVVESAKTCGPWLFEAFERDATAFVPVAGSLGEATSLSEERAKTGGGTSLESGQVTRSAPLLYLLCTFQCLYRSHCHRHYYHSGTGHTHYLTAHIHLGYL